MGVKAERGEGNAKRKDRLAKIKKGPGVFVYNGEAVDTHWEPTVLLLGKNVAVFDSSGMPVTDRAGRQVYEKAGQIVRDSKGQPVMGGEPVKTTKPITTFKLRHVEFPAGKQVAVTNHALALKLRGMVHFDEVDDAQIVEDVAVDAPKKRGRKPKSESGAED